MARDRDEAQILFALLIAKFGADAENLEQFGKLIRWQGSNKITIDAIENVLGMKRPTLAA